MASMLQNRALYSRVLRSSMRHSARSFGAFPSLRVSAAGVTSEGSYAQNLADYLTPDKATVEALDTQLAQKRVGVVSHYYMDSELQGTLAALKYPQVFCADSLAMGHTRACPAPTCRGQGFRVIRAN